MSQLATYKERLGRRGREVEFAPFGHAVLLYSLSPAEMMEAARLVQSANPDYLLHWAVTFAYAVRTPAGEMLMSVLEWADLLNTSGDAAWFSELKDLVNAHQSASIFSQQAAVAEAFKQNEVMQLVYTLALEMHRTPSEIAAMPMEDILGLLEAAKERRKQIDAEVDAARAGNT